MLRLQRSFPPEMASTASRSPSLHHKEPVVLTSSREGPRRHASHWQKGLALNITTTGRGLGCVGFRCRKHYLRDDLTWTSQYSIGVVYLQTEHGILPKQMSNATIMYAHQKSRQRSAMGSGHLTLIYRLGRSSRASGFVTSISSCQQSRRILLVLLL